MKLVYLGLGSNLGDRLANLQSAVDLLAGQAGVKALRVSRVYETQPMYRESQPQFLNAVVEGESRFLPRTLLRRLQHIEHKLGRRRSIKNAPRPIDIDILLYGRFVVEAPELVIPHAGMAERRFVLEPLCELAPDLRHPVLKITMRELLAKAPAGGVAATEHGLRI